MPEVVNNRLAFFAYASNLAEVTRGIEIARVLRDRGQEIQFFTHGGPHEKFIIDAGFELNSLEPVITPEKHEFLIGIEQGRTFRPPFKTDELSAHVASEVAALKQFKPAAVYFGMNFPCAISARTLDLPIVIVMPTPGLPEFCHHGLATFPESHENFLTRLIPQPWKDRFFNWFLPRVRLGVGSFNAVALQYGLPPFKGIFGGVFSGDLILLADLPALTGLPETALPPDCHYIGPLFANLQLPIPEEVNRVFSRPGPNIFLAMGSSAQPHILKTAVMALSKTNYNIVIATTSILGPDELGALPENIYATRYLPAPQVNEMADIAVTHGGQGTLQTACWAGTPVVGVALQAEQQANLDMLARAGMGVRVPIKDFNKTRLLFEIEKVLENVSYLQNARKIQKIIRQSNGVDNAAGLILAFLENKV